MTDGTLEPDVHVSRRTFLVGAAALAAQVTLLAACGPDGAQSFEHPPTTTTLARPVPTTSPAVATKQALEQLVPRLPGFIRAGDATRPWVALTVDDLFGNAGIYDLARLLDVAKAKNVQLTFFPTGGALEGHLRAGGQAVWRRAVAEGHEIGNHGYTHRDFTELSNQELRSELTNTQQMLDRVLGPDVQYTMRLARPPGGAGGFMGTGDPRVMAVLRELGYSMVMWTIDSNNTGGNLPFPYKIVDQAVNGSIVLLHFTTFPVANYPGLIDRLRNERHLEPTNVSGLFA